MSTLLLSCLLPKPTLYPCFVEHLFKRFSEKLPQQVPRSEYILVRL